MYAQVFSVSCRCARQLCEPRILRQLVIAALRRDTITWTHCTRVRDVTSRTSNNNMNINHCETFISHTKVPDLNDVYFLLRTKFLYIGQLYFGEDIQELCGPRWYSG